MKTKMKYPAIASRTRRAGSGHRTGRLAAMLGTLLFAVLTSAAHAIPTGYTDRASFLTDLPGLAAVEGFDTALPGTTIASGGTLGDFTYQYDVLAGFGVSLQVVDDFDTTSGLNSLGTDDGGVLQQGDDVEIVANGPVNAFGLSLILSDIALSDEIRLTANGVTVGLEETAVTNLADGGIAYFLGLIDLASTFTSVSLTTSQCGADCGYFLFSMDDLTTASAPVAVPEPGTFALGVLALALLRIRSRSHKANH